MMVNGGYGQHLSRAMRNRGVEICMLADEHCWSTNVADMRSIVADGNDTQLVLALADVRNAVAPDCSPYALHALYAYARAHDWADDIESILHRPDHPLVVRMAVAFGVTTQLVLCAV
jgi:hypothetical protein